MDEKTINENPFKPLICHRMIHPRNRNGEMLKLQDRLCGADARRYRVVGTKMIEASRILGNVTVWLCDTHANAAKKAGYILEQ